MTDSERAQAPQSAPHRIDRATAEALGYPTVDAADYAEARRDSELLAQLQAEGLL